MDDIPEFLRRTSNQEKQNMITAVQQISGAPITNASGPKSKTRQARKDAYIARLTISIPLDMSNADSLAAAIKAVAAIPGSLPPGAIVEGAEKASLGKI